MNIKIKSNIQDYQVSFVDDHRGLLVQDCKDQNTFFLIDKNVFELYECASLPLDKSRYQVLDAV
mgnify:FL=1